MKPQTLVTALLALVVCFTATAVMGQNPHFVNSKASVQDDGTLLVIWKEAGLGNQQVVTYKATATADAFYGCVIPGQPKPVAISQVKVTAVVSAATAFTGPFHNGVLNGSMVLVPPQPRTFSCPAGLVMMLHNVTYNKLDLWDMTTHLQEYMGGPYSGVMDNL